MGYTLRQTPTRVEKGANQTSATITFTSTPITGNVICVALLWYNATNGTVGASFADGNSAALTIKQTNTSRPTTAGVVVLAEYIVPASPSSTITATFNTTTGSGIATLWASEFSVSGGTAGFDNSAQGTAASGTIISDPSIPVAGSSELLYAAVLSDHQVSTVDSPWTTIAAGAGTNQFAEGVGYILSGSAAQTFNFTENVSSGYVSAGMSFSFTASGGSSPTYPQLERMTRGLERGLITGGVH